MSPNKIQIEFFLSENKIDFHLLAADEIAELKKQWLLTFATRVKKETGVWIHKRFRWHGFSYGLQPAVTGSKAMSDYQKLWKASYVVFDERDNWAYSCASEKYPDFTSFGADIYVTHHNMKWTMAFTHEQPNIGPFLALKSNNVE